MRCPMVQGSKYPVGTLTDTVYSVKGGMEGALCVSACVCVRVFARVCSIVQSPP